MDLRYEDLPVLRKRLKGSGVATESQNRLPLFEPTLRPTYRKRVFENKHGKLLIEGRLGQPHKNLLETILWKKEIYDFFQDGKTKYLKVLYDKEKIRKYLSQGTKYNYGTYKILLKDMILTYIELKTDKLEIQGTLVMEVGKSDVMKPVKSKSPIISEQVPLTTIKFGAVGTALFESELRFTYDPSPIAFLRNGVSQALARYLRTHKNCPPTGYHLKTLVANLISPLENKRWWKIREYLKEDADQLESIGIVIDFKADRLFVIENHF